MLTEIFSIAPNCPLNNFRPIFDRPLMYELLFRSNGKITVRRDPSFQRILGRKFGVLISATLYVQFSEIKSLKSWGILISGDSLYRKYTVTMSEILFEALFSSFFPHPHIT